jgi:hypothetical protein
MGSGCGLDGVTSVEYQQHRTKKQGNARADHFRTELLTEKNDLVYCGGILNHK